MRTNRALAIALLALSGTESIGCWSINKRENDLDRSPVVNTGAGATVIYPGQAAPAHPGNYHPREAGYGQGGVVAVPGNPGASTARPGYPAQGYPTPGSPSAGYPAPSAAAPTGGAPPGAVASQIAVPPPEYGSGSASSSGTAAPRGSNITMLGGAETEETQHVKVDEEPKFLKYLALPFAVLAAPVKYGADKLAGDPVPGPPVPRNESQPRPELHPAAAPTDYETARLQGIDRELAERERPSTATVPPATPAPTAPSTGFADELAALRRRANPSPAPAPAPTTLASAAPVSAPAAAPRPAPAAPTGQVDRDGDGRTDHWITRENGAIAREAFDENFDGVPDRTISYDPASHEAVQIEEDTNFDGKIDAWTALRGGQVVGRRVDANGDGQVDSWSFYQGGVITRLERDANGDGFRDRVAYYQDGRLAREERDDDGDGRTDLITWFDAGEQVSRVEEDANGDGEMDVVSYYEAGHLARREVLDASVLGAGPKTTEHD